METFNLIYPINEKTKKFPYYFLSPTLFTLSLSFTLLIFILKFILNGETLVRKLSSKNFRLFRVFLETSAYLFVGFTNESKNLTKNLHTKIISKVMEVV